MKEATALNKYLICAIACTILFGSSTAAASTYSGLPQLEVTPTLPSTVNLVKYEHLETHNLPPHWEHILRNQTTGIPYNHNSVTIEEVRNKGQL